MKKELISHFDLIYIFHSSAFSVSCPMAAVDLTTIAELAPAVLTKEAPQELEPPQMQQQD